MRKRPEGMEHLTDLIRHFNFTDIINDNDLLRCYDWNVNTSGYYVIKRDIYRKKKKKVSEVGLYREDTITSY